MLHRPPPSILHFQEKSNEGKQPCGDGVLRGGRERDLVQLWGEARHRGAGMGVGGEQWGGWGGGGGPLTSA